MYLNNIIQKKFNNNNLNKVYKKTKIISKGLLQRNDNINNR